MIRSKTFLFLQICGSSQNFSIARVVDSLFLFECCFLDHFSRSLSRLVDSFDALQHHDYETTSRRAAIQT